MKPLLILLSLLLVTSSVSACPFCNPGETDVFSEVADATAVVVVDKVDTRKYKVRESWRGGVKPGRVVVAAEPNAKLGKKGTLLLTTAGPPNLPYWSDAPRILDQAELKFARQALALSEKNEDAQLDFAARHLQSDSSEIALASYNLLAAAPLSEVQRRASIVGTENLHRWARDQKIAPERRALYLLMSYHRLPSSAKDWLKKDLFSPTLAPSSPLVGPLAVAYLHQTGAAGLPAIEKAFYAQQLPAGRTTPLNRALTLVGEQTEEPTLRAGIQNLFRKELKHPQRGAFVLAPLAIWQDFTSAADAESLFYKNGEIPWIKVAVIRYFRSFSSTQSREALGRLAQKDPTLVSRTTDGYRRTDLGID